MPDLDDAETLITEMQGVENSWSGRVLIRLVRHVRVLTRVTQRQDARLAALEQAAGITPPAPQQ